MRRGARNRRTRGSSEGRWLAVFRALDRHRARYVLVGGVALNLHGLMRATEDIDLLIPRDVENAEAILGALRECLAFGIAGELRAEEVVAKPFTIVGDMPRVDLLTVANKVRYEEAMRGALRARVEGVRITYADLKTLLKTKATDRLQDRADIERLRRISGRRPRP